VYSTARSVALRRADDFSGNGLEPAEHEALMTANLTKCAAFVTLLALA